ncbi:MAG: helix-turn-helix transcriptional regulator [Paracoccaceae bacterium]
MSEVSTSGPSKADRDRSPRSLQVAWLLVLFSGLIMLFDIGGELHAALLFPESLSLFVLLHLGTELLAAVALGAAFVIIRREIRVIERQRRRSDRKLGALRDDFDGLARQRFANWKLTRSEADIALLTLRGLKIAEIADARQTQIGTIKSHLSTIFRKSGFSTRTEFVASFIDEFLDFAALPSDAAPQQGQTKPPQTAASTAPTISSTT